MTLRLDERWVWDHWIAIDGDDYHLFFLQAPRSLGDPDLRHRNATVGHAVSRDLRQWRTLNDALRPGPPGAWDDVATWTGSVTRHESRWFMFYTGTSSVEGGRVQRIGLATSTDLDSWEKHPANPLIEADDRWYERLGALDDVEDGAWPEEAWRDPWVFRRDGEFHALLTARSNRGPVDGRGVIGHAVSTDLVSWIVTPPRSTPGPFAHLEVPQVMEVDGQWWLAFSCEASRVSSARRSTTMAPAGDAVYVVRVDDPLGPLPVDQAEISLPAGLYAGRVVHDDTGRPVWLAFEGAGSDGAFVGEISDPIPFPWIGR